MFLLRRRVITNAVFVTSKKFITAVHHWTNYITVAWGSVWCASAALSASLNQSLDEQLGSFALVFLRGLRLNYVLEVGKTSFSQGKTPGISLFLCLHCQVIILIGNKADLEAQRDVTYEEAKQFAEENGEPDDEYVARWEVRKEVLSRSK